VSTFITFKVRGKSFRYRSARRYGVIAMRMEPFTAKDGDVYLPFMQTHFRSDNRLTALNAAAKYGRHNGAFAVVVDTHNGEEIWHGDR
jgi:hypothetical protein